MTITATLTTATPASLDLFGEIANAPAHIEALSAALVDLSVFSCINVTGEESISFLQGQFSNHIPDLAEGECHITGYCNPKGRALAVLWLLRKRDGCFLLAPSDLAEGLVKRLQMYKMRAKVEIAFESTHVIFAAVNAPDTLAGEITAVQQWPIDPNRRFLSIPANSLATLSNTSALSLLDSDYWRIAQILAAEPMVYSATLEALIPQHMNLDLVGGVSFTKGCYPGQEIVARLRYLGKLKQRMIIGVCEGSEPVVPGTPAFIEAKESKAGIVVDAVNVGSFNYLSVNVPASHIDDGEVFIGTADGVTLRRLQMPYTITLEKESV